MPINTVRKIFVFDHAGDGSQKSIVQDRKPAVGQQQGREEKS